MKSARLLLLGLLTALLSVAFFVHATCTPSDTGTAGNDTIACDAANQPAADVEGGAGDDTIYVDPGVVTANNINGGNTGAVAESGNDVIVNDGTVNGIRGDSLNGDGSGNDVIVNNGTASLIVGESNASFMVGTGNDTITNNGNVTGFIAGDSALGDSYGNDTITNNGNVNSVYGDIFNSAIAAGDDTIVNNGTANNVYGDSFNYGGTGDDTITNNGTVNGDIYGDDQTALGTGNDTITNNGVVNGNIDATGGNDTVIINGNTATVGGTINGGSGYDVLTFDLTTTDPAQLRTWAEQIAAANPAGGTITLNGHTYTWANFEELTQLVFSVARLNGIMDPLAVYCSLNSGVDVYTVSGGQGYFSLNVGAQAISNGIAYAQTNATIVELSSSTTSSVSAMPSGELQISNGAGFTFTFTYSNYCGALPAPGAFEGAAAAQAEEELGSG